MSETRRTPEAMEAHDNLRSRVDQLERELAAAKEELAKLRQMVAQQAEDKGLWFNAATAPEAYLQQELRRLHAAVEETK